MNRAEEATNEFSPYDHKPRFMAVEQHREELNTRLEALLEDSEPQPVQIYDPEDRLLLSDEEIKKLWGLFPAGARIRVITNPPIVRSDTPRWFTPESSVDGPVATEAVGEAISPTAHGLARTSYNMRDDGSMSGVNITLHEIPDNGFSDKVKRLVQAGVVIHELAHTVEMSDIWGSASGHQLALPAAGYPIAAREWVGAFADVAEQHPPISRYSSAYRNQDNMFQRENGALVIGPAVREELVESITAHLLGFTVAHQGLTFEPFNGREELQKGVQAYLESLLV